MHNTMRRNSLWALTAVGAACLLATVAGQEAWQLADGALHSAAENCYQGKLVPVDLYGEALCPDTTRFLHGVLGPLFDNGVAGLMKLRYFAYGKAYQGRSGLECQHGPIECRVNRYLNCAQRLHFRNQTDWFGYVLCVQGEDSGRIVKAAAKRCPRQRGWDVEQLASCAEGQLGDRLEALAGRATTPLQLSWIPHVTINGLSVGFDLEHLARYVCVAYTGRDRPAACDNLAVEQPFENSRALLLHVP